MREKPSQYKVDSGYCVVRISYYVCFKFLQYEFDE